MAQVSAFDVTAPTFERDRSLPHGVPQAIRGAILGALDAPSPRLLDLGAGTGRIGWPFVAAGDDYVGVDFSLAMLRAFAQRGIARLVRADGARLPFVDASFDAVMLIQVFSGMPDWRAVVAEARRVLRARGVVVVGRTVAPTDGVDEQMKQQLAAILAEMGAASDRGTNREGALHALEEIAHGAGIEAAAWNDERTPRAFLARHRTGARFAALPAPVKDEALRRLAAWATKRFGSLDAALCERCAFELRIFRFADARPA
jgi:ubiquinone/menaquinone biosynthesis C-methylase UbiE